MIVVQITTDNREPHRQYDQPEPWFGTAPEALFQGFDGLSGIKVHVISCTQRPMRRSPEKLAQNIWFHSLHVPKTGWMRTAYQGCIRAIRGKVREISPDIVHGQGTERECSLGAIFSGYPSVLTIHGNMRAISKVNVARPFSFEWLAARLEGFTVPRSQGVICITQYTRQLVARDRVPTWVIPNAVDQRFFSVEKSSPAVPTILCVGYICVRKNQNMLVRALDRLISQISFRLVCCGRLDEQDSYAREFLALAKSRPWLEYIPWADRQELREKMAQATLVALPSLEDNCPMAVLEAMATGVPVVAAKVGGVPDLVEEGVDGFMLPPDDETAWAGAILKLLTEPDTAREFSAAARTKAQRIFHPRAVAERHIQVYQEVLARR